LVISQHERGLLGVQAAEHAVALGIGDRQHQAIDALAQQFFHHDAFALAAVIGGRQQQAIATHPSGALHGLELFGKHRVEQVGHHYADQLGGLQAQLAAQQIGAKTQLTGGGEHLLTGGRAHLVGGSKSAGGGGAGYARQPGYVFQVSHCHSLEIDLIGEDSSGGMWQFGGKEMTV